MRVGLVLGAGGVVGASWLIGSLLGLADETGWDPREADRIVGTSAGSVVGGLTAAGLAPDLMATFANGEPLPDDLGGLPELEHVEDMAELARDRSVGTQYRLARALPPIGPGSWRLALSTLARPTRHAPAAVVSGWLPRGFVHTDPIRHLVQRFVPGHWPDHPSYWPVACDYSTGRRVAFGSEGAPRARVGDAVAASCAIPAFYHPVEIAGRRYVDGGICSPSNLDLLCGHGLDLVVCLNPMSSRARATGLRPGERMAGAVRVGAGRRLGREARKLRDEGTHVLLLQPTRADLTVMGLNLMARDRRAEVIQRARETARVEVRTLRAAGQLLPGPRRRGRGVAVAQSRPAA